MNALRAALTGSVLWIVGNQAGKGEISVDAGLFFVRFLSSPMSRLAKLPVLML